MGSTLKGEDIATLGAFSFQLRINPISEGFYLPEKLNSSHGTCLPLKTWLEIMKVYPSTLNTDTVGIVINWVPVKWKYSQLSIPQSEFIQNNCTERNN